MTDIVELEARALRAERRLAELQTVLRETDRDRMWDSLQHAQGTVTKIVQTNRRYRLWLRRARTFDRVTWMLFGIQLGYLLFHFTR